MTKMPNVAGVDLKKVLEYFISIQRNTKASLNRYWFIS